jgi:hypothetical protein
MTISIGTSPGVPSPLQPLLQPNAADDGDAASPGNPVAGLFQSTPFTASDPKTSSRTAVDTQTTAGVPPLDPGTIGGLISLQSKPGSDGNGQIPIPGTQDGRTADSPVNRTDPRHLPAATPTHAHRHRHTLASDGVSFDSSSFAQNAVSSPTSTAADDSGLSGSPATNVAGNQNILLDQLIQLQKQLVTVANPILSTFI